jgi:hypothetical protein
MARPSRFSRIAAHCCQPTDRPDELGCRGGRHGAGAEVAPSEAREPLRGLISEYRGRARSPTKSAREARLSLVVVELLGSRSSGGCRGKLINVSDFFATGLGHRGRRRLVESQSAPPSRRGRRSGLVGRALNTSQPVQVFLRLITLDSPPFDCDRYFTFPSGGGTAGCVTHAHFLLRRGRRCPRRVDRGLDLYECHYASPPAATKAGLRTR